MNSVENLNKNLEDNNIKWVQLHFTDLIGRLRSLHLPIDTFFKNSVSFTHSKGFLKVILLNITESSKMLL